MGVFKETIPCDIEADCPMCDCKGRLGEIGESDVADYREICPLCRGSGRLSLKNALLSKEVK